MGKSIVAAALLCVPFAANAGKIVVEYTVTVSSIDRALAEAPPYSVDDPIMGTPIIGTAPAPADRLASDGQVGRYYGDALGLDLIFGAKHPGERGVGEIRNVVNLTVDRLSVKPGVCRP